jgi:hypothetical protein
MNYRAFVKKQLMGGKLYKVLGFGIGVGARPQMLLNHYSGGTISHRPIVGPLIPDIGSLSVHPSKKLTSGGRIRKIYDDEKTGKGKKFNSLKFNF